MSHDKESIKKLQKAKGFDTEIDPLVLGIDEEERVHMVKSIEEAETGYTDEKKKFNPMAGFGEGKKKKKKKSMSFFSKIIDFFKHLLENLGFGDHSNMSSKEIKRIKQNISDFGNDFVNFKSKKIDSGFARYIYEIHQVFNQVKTLFEEAYMENSEISLGQPIFFVRFISNVLSEETKQKLKIFTNEYINKLIENENSPMVVLKTRLQDFENSISINERANINAYIEPIERILTCYSFNFEKFLRSFIPYNPELHKSNEEELEENSNEIYEVSPEKFGEIGIEEIIGELKKINDYLRVLDMANFTEEFYDNFDNTLTSLQTETETDEEKSMNENDEPKVKLDNSEKQKKNIKDDNKYDNININSEDIEEAFNKIKKLNDSDILDGIIRYFSNDASYKGRMVKIRIFIIEKYIELLKEKAVGNFNYLETYKREQKIVNNITKFFGVKTLNNLSRLKNYNESVNTELQKRHIDVFRNVKKSILLKNFIEKIYKQDVEAAIKNILVEGDFIDKDAQQDFSESFYKIEQRQKDFEDFEFELSDESEEMLKVKNFLYSAMHDISVKNVARRKIREIDEMCNVIFKDFVVQLNTILNYLEKCINDSKSSRPVFIYNMRNISGANNKIFLNTVYQAYDEINEFLNIAKNFTLIHEKIT